MKTVELRGSDQGKTMGYKENKKVYVKTFGCSTNIADSLVMKRILAKSSYEIVDDYDISDIIIINSCTVKQNSQTKFFRELRRAKQDKKLIVATGCVVEAQKEIKDSKELEGVSIIGTAQLESIAKVVDKLLLDRRMVLLDKKDKNPLLIPYQKYNDAIAIVPVAEGCLGHCSYCKTKQARGNLLSYPIKDIVCTIERFISAGAKEIWLTSQDIGAYGIDKGGSVVELLESVSMIKGDFFIRLGMANPAHIKRHKAKICRIINESKNFFRFIHIPLQAGSDAVLRRMERDYTTKEFLEICDFFKRNIKELTLSTDVITGFPLETESDFKKTLDVINEIRPNVLNISRFWARPNTKAKEFKNHMPEVGIERARQLKELFNKIALEENEKWLGRTFRCVIDEFGKNGSIKGRNSSYKELVFKNGSFDKDTKIGDFIKAKVIDYKEHHLICEEVL